MNFSVLSLPQRVSAGAIVVVALAAFLPWISIFGISVIGIEGDGQLTLLLALAGGAVLALTSGVFGEPRWAGQPSRVALLIMAGLVAVIGLSDMNGAAAIGLYLTMFGGIAWLAGAVWELVTTKDPVAPDAGV